MTSLLAVCLTFLMRCCLSLKVAFRPPSFGVWTMFIYIPPQRSWGHNTIALCSDPMIFLPAVEVQIPRLFPPQREMSPHHSCLLSFAIILASYTRCEIGPLWICACSRRGSGIDRWGGHAFAEYLPAIRRRSSLMQEMRWYTACRWGVVLAT